MSNTANMDIAIKALVTSGITNPYSISGILAIISKESGFVPQSEISYSKTANSRIQALFEKTRSLTDPQLTTLKADPVKFFNYIYGGRYGNAANEGYKYRGRGFNQLTFKDNYALYGKILGLDLVNNPDLVNKPEIAAKVVAAYFKRQFEKYPALILDRYQAININDFRSTKTAVNAFYNANAGLGKDTSNISTGGKTAALSKVESIYNITTKFLGTKTGKITGSIAVVSLTGLFFCSFIKDNNYATLCNRI